MNRKTVDAGSVKTGANFTLVLIDGSNMIKLSEIECFLREIENIEKAERHDEYIKC